MKTNLELLFFCLFFLQYFVGYGQNQESMNLSTGIPFISNFSPEEYEADPQNWSITQDKQGIIYVANTLGILKFDGVEWQKINLDNIICRSLATDDKGRIYVGSQGDIGFLEADAIGNLKYISLLDKIPEKEQNFTDVWTTFYNKNGVFFFTNNKIFCLKNNQITTFKAPKKFNFCFNINDIIYSQDDSLGMCQIADNQLTTAKNTAFFLNKETRVMMPYKDGKILIATLKNGLFIYNPADGEITNFKNNIAPYLLENIIFCGRKLSENLYVIGTFRGGLVLFDAQGNLLQIINEERGLRNLSVRQTFFDTHKGLWLALNNGIARIELNSPLSIFDKRNGLKGSLNHIASYQNKLFVGTSLGFFQTEFLKDHTGYDFAGFKQMPNFLDQAWKLSEIANDLFIASNRGTFIYDANKIILNYSENAAFTHLLITVKNKQYVLAGLRNGIEIFEHNDEHWSFLETLSSVSGEIRTLVQDADGAIWAGTKVNGIYKIEFSTDLNKPKIENYSQKHGLPSNKQNKVFLTSKGIIVGTTKGFYRFNSSKQQFEIDNKLKIPTNIPNEQESWNLYEDKVGNFWVFAGRFKAVFVKQKDGSFIWNYAILSRIPYETISNVFEHENKIWVASANALYAYNKKFDALNNQDFHVLFRRISLINTDSIIAGSYYVGETPKLSFRNNSISFDFAATYFENSQANQYQYQLEGYEKNWSAWTHTPQKDYTNLWNGTYTLKVKAKNIYGVISNETTYQFVISPPWYRTNIAYFAYIILLILIIFVIIRYNIQQLERKNKKLEDLVTLRTVEIQQQKEEIESQRDNLVNLNEDLATQKNEVQQSYNKMQILNEIGTEITSILQIEHIVTFIYDNVNKLMDAPILAAGIYNEQRNKLEFYGIDDQHKEMVYSSDSLDDTTKLSVWCYQNQKEIFINDIQTESQNYVQKLTIPTGTQMSNSLIYIPLLVKGKKSGVITVQSHKSNAYNNYQRTIFINLATYISIALENANTYKVISIKNKQITDSIRYAETIQKAILPPQHDLQEAFGNNYFIFYQAKDVVSGDFYWLSIKNINTVFVATVDCTGHGVPGAFMSLIGATLLNEIVEQKGIESPAKIIENLHEQIRIVLRQKDMLNRDGMDLCLCRLEKNDTLTQLTYSGAKRPLYYINKFNELEQIRSTHKSIGGGNKEHINFEEFSYALQTGEMIYLTTDGYTDQNNADNEKLGSLKLKTTLLEIASLEITEQYEQIKLLFNTHKSNEQQRDDVTVMGIRIS